MLKIPHTLATIDPFSMAVKRFVPPVPSQADLWSDAEFAELVRQRAPQVKPEKVTPIATPMDHAPDKDDPCWCEGTPPEAGIYWSYVSGKPAKRVFNGTKWFAAGGGITSNQTGWRWWPVACA